MNIGTAFSLRTVDETQTENLHPSKTNLNNSG